ncbi:MAG: hypothetical protein ACJA1R_001449, partial [Flavobacteriales bacterium]
PSILERYDPRDTRRGRGRRVAEVAEQIWRINEASMDPARLVDCGVRPA